MAESVTLAVQELASNLPVANVRTVRTREIGIRMALGAEGGSVVSMGRAPGDAAGGRRSRGRGSPPPSRCRER